MHAELKYRPEWSPSWLRRREFPFTELSSRSRAMSPTGFGESAFRHLRTGLRPRRLRINRASHDGGITLCYLKPRFHRVRRRLIQDIESGRAKTGYCLQTPVIRKGDERAICPARDFRYLRISKTKVE